MTQLCTQRGGEIKPQLTQLYTLRDGELKTTPRSCALRGNEWKIMTQLCTLRGNELSTIHMAMIQLCTLPADELKTISQMYIPRGGELKTMTQLQLSYVHSGCVDSRTKTELTHELSDVCLARFIMAEKIIETTIADFEKNATVWRRSTLCAGRTG